MEEEVKTQTKTKKAVKKKAVQKPPEDLVLNRTISIPSVMVYEDGKTHYVQGGLFKPGTVVTQEMMDAYEAVRKNIGGKTPITKFCD